MVDDRVKLREYNDSAKVPHGDAAGPYGDGLDLLSPLCA